MSEPVRLLVQLAPALVVAEISGAARGQSFRRIDVALHFSERDRPFRQPAIGMKDRIERVLPALVGQALSVAR